MGSNAPSRSPKLTPEQDSSGGESSESEKETGSDSEAFYGDYGPPPPSPSPERDAGPSTFEGDLGAGPSVPKRVEVGRRGARTRTRSTLRLHLARQMLAGKERCQ